MVPPLPLTGSARTARTVRLSLLAVSALWLTACGSTPLGAGPDLTKEPQMTAQRIRPSEKRPDYWFYGNGEVLLIGGSVEDNLFQIPDLEEHLDLLAACGGNYVRCTMSSRDEGNVWPFEQVDGLYDLDRPSKEFWRRFSEFLRLTSEREIIVQIEVWATFDYYRDNWDVNPFNPKNNRNYSEEESGLPLVVATHPTRTENPFFWSVPAEHNNSVVLRYQQLFVDELLRHALPYPNVLYAMDNETSVTPAWGAYWSEYIKARAAEAGLSVETTEMWDPWELDHEMHSNTIEHPETYSFVEVSQNNHNSGQHHWDNLQRTRERIFSIKVRPITNVKIYGADTGRYGTTRDAIERMWRNILGGCASARFHRPSSGIGLSPEAQGQIKSLRMLTDEMEFVSCNPHNDLLTGREENEAYCLADPEREAAVFFPKAGEVVLDTSAMKGKNLRVRWLNPVSSEWISDDIVPAADKLTLKTPLETTDLEGMQAVLVQQSDAAITMGTARDAAASREAAGETARNRDEGAPSSRLAGTLHPKAPMRKPVEHRDLSFADVGSRELKLDLYLPPEGQGAFPLVIWIHGGAWMGGSKESARAVADLLVPEGFAVAGISYRLSWESTFPAQIMDCRAAVRFLRAKAIQYHLDPARFGVWGSSAGGHLAALLGTSPWRKEWDDFGEYRDLPANVQAVCDWYGPSDFLRMSDAPGQIDHDSESSPESRLVGGAIQSHPHRVAEANPITYIRQGTPPFLIMHGVDDRTVPINQSELLSQALADAGASVTFVRLEGTGHGGEAFRSEEAQRQVVDFFRQHLQSQTLASN